MGREPAQETRAAQRSQSAWLSWRHPLPSWPGRKLTYWMAFGYSYQPL